MTDIRTDSQTLNRVFARVANHQTGIGTARDKATAMETSAAPWLTREELRDIAQIGIIHSICWTYPQMAKVSWYQYKQTTKRGSLDLVKQYYRDLQDKPGGMTLRDAFVEVSGLAREYGDAYILVGVDDGKPLHEPFTFDSKYTVQWLRVFSRWEVQPEYTGDPKNPRSYRILLAGEANKQVHASRIRRFPGIPLEREALNFRQGCNLSIIESMITSYYRWESAIATSNTMLANHQLRTLGMKDLARLIKEDVKTKTTKNQDMLAERLRTLDMGTSAARTVLYDLSEEQVDNLNISYGGVENILEFILDSWIADLDVPRSIVLNELGKSSMTSGEAYRMANFDLARRVQSWQYENWLSHLEWFTKLAANASDCKARIPSSGFEIIFPLNYTEDPSEAADNAKAQAEKAKILVEAGIFTAEEIRASYRGSEFDPYLNPDS